LGISVLLDVWLCRVDGSRLSEEHCAFIFTDQGVLRLYWSLDPCRWSHTFRRNVGTHLPKNSVTSANTGIVVVSRDRLITS